MDVWAWFSRLALVRVEGGPDEAATILYVAVEIEALREQTFLRDRPI